MHVCRSKVGPQTLFVALSHVRIKLGPDLIASSVSVGLDNDHLMLFELELVDKPVVVSGIQLRGMERNGN